MGPKAPMPTILVSSNIPVPCSSGRVFMQPDRFMYLGKSFKAILEEHETDPTHYNESMSSDDYIIWQGTMEAELKIYVF